MKNQKTIFEKQKELFEKIKSTSAHHELFSAFVQNDLTRLIKDGYITKETLRATLSDIQLNVHKVEKIQELELLKVKEFSEEIMEIYRDCILYFDEISNA